MKLLKMVMLASLISIFAVSALFADMQGIDLVGYDLYSIGNPVEFCVSGNYAFYVGGMLDLAVFDISNLNAPHPVSWMDVPSNYAIKSVSVMGQYVYLMHSYLCLFRVWLPCSG